MGNNLIFTAVKQRVSLRDIIEKDEPLHRKNNRDYQGAHKAGGHPSTSGDCLSVDPNDGIWHCFNCKEGGSVIDYVAYRDGLSPFEAALQLAREYGITVDKESIEEGRKAEEERTRIRVIMREGFEFYYRELCRNEAALTYLTKRGITKDTIDRLKLGYAAGGNALLQHMRQQGYKDDELLKTGLFEQKNDGAIRDNYYERYVFTYWQRDEIVFSIGRASKPSQRPKYLKHRTPDNYDYVSKVAVQHVIWRGSGRGRRMLIAEGMVDAILAQQALPDWTVISPITTTFKKEQHKQLIGLCRGADEVVIVNDNEDSGEGEAGAVDTATVLIGAGIHARIGMLPKPAEVEKIDIGELFEQHKPDQATEMLRQTIETAAPVVDHLIGKLEGAPSEVAARVKQLAPLLAGLSNIESKLYTQRAAARAGLATEDVAAEVRAAITEARKEKTDEKSPPQTSDNKRTDFDPERDAPPVGGFLEESLQTMTDRHTGILKPVPVPWEKLGKALGGGFWPGLYILNGTPGAGKSQLALQAALYAARNEINTTPVLYVGLELGKVDLVARLLGLLTGQYWSELYLGVKSVDPADAAVAALRNLPFRLRLVPPMGWTYTEFHDEVQALTDTIGTPPLVVLDYLQLVQGPPGMDLRERIGKAAYQGRTIARDMGAVVILVSSVARDKYAQLTGKREKDRRGNFIDEALGDGLPSRLLGTGKEAGEIEFAADAVLVLARDGECNWLAIAKLRAGKTRWVELRFDGNQFSEPKPDKEVNLDELLEREDK